MIERLGDAVAREVAALGEQPGMAELVAAWPTAVGPQIARNAWPARLARDGTLHVATADSAWAYELTQLGPELLRRLGPHAPKKLNFAPGPIPESDVGDVHRDARKPPPAPGPEAMRRAAALAAPIADEELRELVARAAAASLERAASGRSF